MKKSSLTGWRKVFSFTLIQNLKPVSSKVFFLILLAAGLVSMPLLEKLVPAADSYVEISADGEYDESANIAASDEKSPIDAIYFRNETDFAIENLDDFFTFYPAFSESEVSTGALDFDTWNEEMKNHFGNNGLYVSLTLDETGLNLLCKAPLKTFLEMEDIEAFEYSFSQYLELKKLEWSGLSAEQIETLQTPVSGSITQLDENGEPVEDFMFNNSEYWTSYTLILLSIIIIAVSAEGIAVSVLTEKSSKIVEYLMMSVKPLALIIGKTLAMLCVVLVQFAGLIAGILLSCFINGYITEGKLLFMPASSMKQFLSLEIFQSVNPGVIILAVLIVAAGVLFYGTLAGIAGAGASRMEEIGEALKLYNIIMIIGAYFGLGIAISTSGGGVSVLNYIAYFLPLSSPFIVPVHMILGKLSPFAALGSLALLVLFIALALKLASRIYGNMLFYNGKPMKLKDLIQFAKNSGKEAD